MSTGTVSNALNHPDRVHPETLQRIWSVISELGYVPSHAARLLSGAPSKTVGLVVPDIRSPFFMQLAHSVERPARSSGYSLLLCNSENEAIRESQALTDLAVLQAEGALVSPAGDTKTLSQQPPLPVVYLDHAGSQGSCAVLVDHHRGGQAVAEHLLALGHRRVTFVQGKPELWQFEQRLSGVRETFVEHGLDPAVHISTVVSDGIGVDSGTTSARRLLSQDNLPTAIFCANDMLAFGVHKGLGQAGIRIPQDVSLVGYDDNVFAGDWITPLTTVHQPMDEMGELAGTLLIEHALAGAEHRHRTVLLEPTLVVRESTAPPRA